MARLIERGQVVQVMILPLKRGREGRGCSIYHPCLAAAKAFTPRRNPPQRSAERGSFSIGQVQAAEGVGVDKSEQRIVQFDIGPYIE